MLRALHANCFPPPGIEADLLLTDECSVARQAASELAIAVRNPERAVDSALAHRTSVEMWRQAFSWYRREGEDETLIGGVSVGDLAGLEAAIAVLGPAARGALSMAATIEQGCVPSTLVSVVPSHTRDGARYDRLERLAGDAAVAAAQHLTAGPMTVERVSSDDPRNQWLRDKYARTRDPQILLDTNVIRTAQRVVFEVANRIALLRRHRGRSLLVVEYNPTLTFSRAYRAQAQPRRRLVRWITDPREIVAATWAGDIVQGAATAGAGVARHRIGRSLAVRADELAGASFDVAGVDLWPLVLPRLLELVDRYASYVEKAAPRLRDQLRRWKVDAVLVPFDTNPAVRLLVRVAQSLGIPTFVVNDGYKGDEIQVEGMSTDVALAWSSAIADHYFVRHPGKTVVSGNPRFASARAPVWRPPGGRPLRVLVGTFTFSPVDLNCRRSDSEQFLCEVLAGIAAARPAVLSEVVVKLHPADEPDYYRDLLARHPGLQVNLRTDGDVVDLFAHADVYLTTYSTSLLEAAATMPVIYYRVNEQRLGPPFDGDDFLSSRTASTPPELMRLLGDRETLSTPPPAGWIERYLGPGGADERIVAVIEAEIASGSRAAEAHTAPDAVPRH